MDYEKKANEVINLAFSTMSSEKRTELVAEFLADFADEVRSELNRDA